jgi:hypothetical protein
LLVPKYCYYDIYHYAMYISYLFIWLIQHIPDEYIFNYIFADTY